MAVPTWVWILTVVGILVMLAVDLVGHVRKPHAPTLREASWWSAAYVAVGLGFGLVVLAGWGGDYASQYYAGYLTEKSLSVDNLFVFLLIMGAFAVPRIYQQKVLFVGIVLALILRTIFILVGAAAVNTFAWVFYIFGGLLIWTAIMQLKSPDDSDEEPRIVSLVRRVIPTTEGYHDGKMTVKIDGKRAITPMLVVMVAIGAADILFAVDSIPAIFGLTEEVYLIFAANALSLLGLRQLFFLIDGLLDRLVYLHYGLAAILGFIGVKLVIHALHENTVPFINGGEPVRVIPEVSIAVSLSFILAVLVITTLTSVAASRRGARLHQPEPSPPGLGSAADPALAESETSGQTVIGEARPEPPDQERP